MTCGFDKGLLAALYDGEVTPEERAEAERHVASCPECARDLDSMKRLSASLKPLGRAAAPMSIAEGVMRGIQAERPARRRMFPWVSTAAAAMLLAAVTLYVLDRPKPSPVHTVADRGPRPVAKELAPIPRSAAPSREESRQVLEDDHRESKDEEPLADGLAPAMKARGAPKPASDPAKSPPPAPAAELAAPAAPQPEVPVIVVQSSNLPAARGTVDTFLKVRGLTAETGASLLGLGAFVRQRYLQLDLSDDEVAQLQTRLAKLETTILAKSSLEIEKKKVAEDRSRMGGRADGGDKEADQDHLAEAAKKPEGERFDRKGTKTPPRKTVILVFEEKAQADAK